MQKEARHKAALGGFGEEKTLGTCGVYYKLDVWAPESYAP